MDSVQQELLSVLLKGVYAKGLLSKAAYLNAEDLIHSTTAFPDFFRQPAGPENEQECVQEAQ